MKHVLYLGAAPVLFAGSTAHTAEAITYKYDVRGWLVEIMHTETVNNNDQINYTHDKANNRKTVTTTGSVNTPPPYH